MMGPSRWFAAGVVATLVTTACSEDACPTCDDPERKGQVANAELTEVSGVTASGRFDDVFYAHNDSSDRARFFALATDGSDLASFEVDGADNDDWEDIARARCASGDCLYLADIGDNELLRTNYAVYLVDEPATIEPGVHTLSSQSLSFSYPDGPHDAEVLLVHPLTGVVTIVTKVEDGPAGIYELGQLTPDVELVALKRGELTPPKGSSKFTGGAIHPEATGVLLRTKTRLFYWPMDPKQTAAEALRNEACRLELADEVQGEAVAWQRSGDGIVTIGEGLNAAVNVSRCGGA